MVSSLTGRVFLVAYKLLKVKIVFKFKYKYSINNGNSWYNTPTHTEYTGKDICLIQKKQFSPHRRWIKIVKVFLCSLISLGWHKSPILWKTRRNSAPTLFTLKIKHFIDKVYCAQLEQWLHKLWIPWTGIWRYSENVIVKTQLLFYNQSTHNIKN